MEKQTKTFQFKTNINCGGCVASVKPHLDQAEGVCDWEVDTNDKNKTLTVKATEATQDHIMEAVRKAGFKIETLTHKPKLK